MTTKTPNIDLADLFADLDLNPHEEWLHHKREDTAMTINSMLAQANLNRAELARKLDWKPSRVTRALSGNENLTINTLAEIVNAAGYDFDLLLRRRNTCRAFQPWEREAVADDLIATHAKLTQQLSNVGDLTYRAEVMLDTVTQISRAAYRRSSRRASLDQDAVAANTTWSEDDAPIARKA